MATTITRLSKIYIDPVKPYTSGLANYMKKKGKKKMPGPEENKVEYTHEGDAYSGYTDTTVLTQKHLINKKHGNKVLGIVIETQTTEVYTYGGGDCG